MSAGAHRPRFAFRALRGASGAFKLRFDGDSSAALNPGSSAAEMKAALDAHDPHDIYQLQEVTAERA